MLTIWNMASEVFTDKKVRAVILLYALYGVSYQLFAEANRRPTGLLFVAGESGVMKTSVSRVFYTMFNSDEDHSPMQFNSTLASLDPAIGEAKDTILLLDDFCPKLDKPYEVRKHMKEMLERVIRIYGDGSSRRKSSTEYKLHEAPRATGGAVITGEMTAE